MAAKRRFPLPELSVALWIGLLAGLLILGSDLLWVVAMGDVIRDTATVPHSIPFASAPQANWHNPVALAQVLLSLVHAAGPSGLATLHLVVVAATLSVVVAESRRLRGGDVRTTVVVALVVLGCASTFAVVRFPELSLLPFAITGALLRRQHAAPSRALWWVVPLFALWGNLHGGVLVGGAVLAVFLIASGGSGSLIRRALVGAASLSALLATSAGLGTPAYYLAVLSNEAAARGSELWAAPDLGSPLDLTMLAAAAVLLAMCMRRGLPLWEWLAAAGLLVAMALTARNGIWLILFVAPAAAGQRSLRAVIEPLGPRPRWWWPVIGAAAAVSLLACFWQLDRRAEQVGPPGSHVVATVRAVAGGRPVLADEPLGETLAQAGLTVWAANPLDAFPRDVQAQFLDFLDDGRVPPAASDVDVAVVHEHLLPNLLAGGRWLETARDSGYVVLTRQG